MTVKKKRTSAQRIDRILDQVLDHQTEQIDEALTKVNKLLEPYEGLKKKRDRLQAARRALLGGTRQTGAGTTQLRQEDIIAHLRDHPGSSAGDIAKEHNVNQNTVSSALYRGKDERYLTKDKKWYLRDPKNGINTIDDIEEDK